jgi:hypothetical protein
MSQDTDKLGWRIYQTEEGWVGELFSGDELAVKTWGLPTKKLVAIALVKAIIDNCSTQAEKLDIAMNWIAMQILSEQELREEHNLVIPEPNYSNLDKHMTSGIKPTTTTTTTTYNTNPISASDIADAADENISDYVNSWLKKSKGV